MGNCVDKSNNVINDEEREVVPDESRKVKRFADRRSTLTTHGSASALSNHSSNYRKFRMLLLGAGESGKSTILKQMRIMHGKKLSDEELDLIKVHVRSNIVVAMRKLCDMANFDSLEGEIERDAMSRFQTAWHETVAGYYAASVDGSTRRLSLTDKDDRNALISTCAHIIGEVNEDESQLEVDGIPLDDWYKRSTNVKASKSINLNAIFFLCHWKIMETLWRSHEIRRAWVQDRTRANIIEGHGYYLDNLERIAKPDYKPSEADYLLCRMQTTYPTIEKIHLEHDRCDFDFIDVGGQRNMRRHWRQLFDEAHQGSIDAVIFVAALSEYDQTLSESKARRNRMEEAIELFSTICSNRDFEGIPVLLFLNKKDIFADKIFRSRIDAQPAFSDYPGRPGNFEHGCQYFEQIFQSKWDAQKTKELFVHITNALDQSNMRFVMNCIKWVVMNHNLEASGLFSRSYSR